MPAPSAATILAVRVVSDVDVCGGSPRFRDTRLPVTSVLGDLGLTDEAFSERYPGTDPHGRRVALAWRRSLLPPSAKGLDQAEVVAVADLFVRLFGDEASLILGPPGAAMIVEGLAAPESLRRATRLGREQSPDAAFMVAANQALRRPHFRTAVVMPRLDPPAPLQLPKGRVALYAGWKLALARRQAG